MNVEFSSFSFVCKALYGYLCVLYAQSLASDL